MTDADSRVGREEEALQEFLREWKTLPVLVRAGVAGAIAQNLGIRSTHLMREAGELSIHGMVRRSEVARKFANAYDYASIAFVMLANAADDEAVSCGIDLDTHNPT